MPDAEIHRSARKHGFTDKEIWHALRQAVVVSELEPNADPPRVLAIGPDPGRRRFYALLEKGDH